MITKLSFERFDGTRVTVQVGGHRLRGGPQSGLAVMRCLNPKTQQWSGWCVQPWRREGRGQRLGTALTEVLSRKKDAQEARKVLLEKGGNWWELAGQ